MQIKKPDFSSGFWFFARKTGNFPVYLLIEVPLLLAHATDEMSQIYHYSTHRCNDMKNKINYNES